MISVFILSNLAVLQMNKNLSEITAPKVLREESIQTPLTTYQNIICRLQGLITRVWHLLATCLRHWLIGTCKAAKEVIFIYTEQEISIPYSKLQKWVLNHYSWKATIVPRFFDVLGDTTCSCKPNLQMLRDQIYLANWLRI